MPSGCVLCGFSGYSGTGKSYEEPHFFIQGLLKLIMLSFNWYEIMSYYFYLNFLQDPEIFIKGNEKIKWEDRPVKTSNSVYSLRFQSKFIISHYKTIIPERNRKSNTVWKSYSTFPTIFSEIIQLIKTKKFVWENLQAKRKLHM